MVASATAAGLWSSQVVANPVVEQAQLAGQAVRSAERAGRVRGEIAERSRNQGPVLGGAVS